MAEQITAALRVLIGRPLTDCARMLDMQLFEFGPTRRVFNRRSSKWVEEGEVRLHLQCSWRFVDASRIYFGRSDLTRPADASTDPADFDWKRGPSALDAAQTAWFAGHRSAGLKVVAAVGDPYGGFRIELERGFLLACVPDETGDDERWRLLPPDDAPHFVVEGGRAHEI